MDNQVCWAHQHNLYECGPIALYNLEMWNDSRTIKYGVGQLIQLCQSYHGGTSHVLFGRILCNMAATYNWRVVGKNTKIKMSELKLASRDNTAIIINFYNPSGIRHYSVIVNYNDDLFLCINWSGIHTKPYTWVTVEEMLSKLHKGVIWTIDKTQT